jgi:hypothetical protein
VRTPRPEGGCHQCWTSPSWNWRLAHSSRCSRTSAGRGMDQRHRVLQLVTEAEGAARLVIAAARPDPAGQRLVDQPAVGQHVDRRDRVSPPARTERAPTAGAPLECVAGRHGAAKTLDQLRRASSALRPTPRRKTISRSSPSASSKATWSAAQGSSPGADRPERRARRIAAGSCRVPLRPRNSVGRRSPCASDRRHRRTRRVRQIPCCRDCAQQSARCAGRPRC